MGVDSLPSRRFIDVKYRGLEVKQVPVINLVSEIECRMMSFVKAAAIASDLLPALTAEQILGFKVQEFDKVLRVDPLWLAVVKAGRFL